jgi:hypothetical protein
MKNAPNADLLKGELKEASRAGRTADGCTNIDDEKNLRA